MISAIEAIRAINNGDKGAFEQSRVRLQEEFSKLKEASMYGEGRASNLRVGGQSLLLAGMGALVAIPFAAATMGLTLPVALGLAVVGATGIAGGNTLQNRGETVREGSLEAKKGTIALYDYLEQHLGSSTAHLAFNEVLGRLDEAFLVTKELASEGVGASTTIKEALDEHDRSTEEFYQGTPENGQDIDISKSVSDFRKDPNDMKSAPKPK